MNTLTTATVAAITREVACFGARGVETGGFILGGVSELPILALAAEAGITRRPHVFAVSGQSLARLFSYAEDRKVHVECQFHSHGSQAFLSRTDVDHGFSVEGFITAVVPHYKQPPPDPAEWGWWQYNRGRWARLDCPAVVEAGMRLVLFDQEGVREA